MYNVCNSLNIHKQNNPEENHTDLRLIFFGRLDPAKGLVEFIEAIRHSTIDYSFTIIGEGEEFSDIQRVIERYKLQDKIILKQKQSQAELFAGLSHYDVCVLPSLWFENAPLSIVEAASLGLGLFLSNHGGVLEIGKICNAGHFFNPFDPDDVVSKLEILYKDFLAGDLPKADPEKLQALFSRETYIENLKKYIM
jgi:glycosyltransferase involved in cell wall biosynthesis